MFDPFAYLGTPFQGGILATLLLILGVNLRSWIVGAPDRLRANTNREEQEVKAAADLRDEYALRYKETRVEVQALRNELREVKAELTASQNKSTRRGDKLNMVLFILRMVMDELSSQDKNNKVLAQAKTLLSRVDDEPHDPNNSDALNAAEHTVEAAQDAVHEVRASEAKK